MIETTILHHVPPILYQKVTMLDEETILHEVLQGRKVLAFIQRRTNTYHLLLDLQAVDNEKPYSLKAHGIWAREFKQHPDVLKGLRKCALIGNKNEKFLKEKELLSSESLQFFLDKTEAIEWLTAKN